MKKIIILFLLITCISTTIFATEQNYSILTENILEQDSEVIVVNARVIEAGEVYDQKMGDINTKMQDVKVKVTQGEFKGQVFDTSYILSYDMENKILAYELDKGNTVSLQIHKTGEQITQTIVQDVVRQNYIIYMIITFFALIMMVGRKQGLKAIIGLIVTVVAIFTIMLNLIYKGYSPILVSVLTSAIIIIITFIIIAGINKKSFTAAIGTTGGVLCSGIMAFIFGVVAKLSGGAEEAIYLSMTSKDIVFNFRELLFAGIVIASLGACMDVGMSIASALDELKQKKPDMTWKELFTSGMNIGGDVIGTMTNTLILAYVGGALNLILLFMASDMSILDIINKEMIATDAISAIAGSMGVIFTVPITAFIYGIFNKDKTKYKTKSDNIIEGKRSLKI